MLGTSFVQFKLDYPSTWNLPIGDPIVDRVLAGGRTWRIACFPRGFSGDLSNNGDYLSFIAVTNTRHGVKAVFQAFPMGRDGAPSLSGGKWSSVTLGTRSDRTIIGWPNFMKRSELESTYLVDGCVTFACGIIDLSGNDRVPVPPSDLGNHLGHLLECTDGSDVSFSVGGEMFCGHRAILAARSPVFKAQLLGSMADAQMDCITLHDVQPAAFRILLRFLYTDELPSDTDLIKDDPESASAATDLLQHLLAAADMYQLDRLKLMCAQKLWDRVSPETVAAMLVCAETHNCPELKERCIDFFVVDKNFKSAVLTESYSRLIQGFPSVIEEIRARVVQP